MMRRPFLLVTFSMVLLRLSEDATQTTSSALEKQRPPSL